MARDLGILCTAPGGSHSLAWFARVSCCARTGRMRLRCFGCLSRKANKDDNTIRRVPLRALPRIRTHRLSTGGLKPLHGCGRISRSILDLLKSVKRSRSDLRIRMYSGSDWKTWRTDFGMREFLAPAHAFKNVFKLGHLSQLFVSINFEPFGRDGLVGQGKTSVLKSCQHGSSSAEGVNRFLS